jgi:hypothetical protein
MVYKEFCPLNTFALTKNIIVKYIKNQNQQLYLFSHIKNQYL